MEVRPASKDLGGDYIGKGMVDICRYLRRCGSRRGFRVEKREHKSNRGANVHLFRLIEACGIGVEEFVAGYLSVIQPYMLDMYQGSRSINKKDIWVVNIGYRVSMVIKIENYKTDSPVVISFHENNINGRSAGKKRAIEKDRLCCVIIDEVTAESNVGLSSIKFTVQKGFIRYEIECGSENVSRELALVRFGRIDEEYDEFIRQAFIKVYEASGIEGEISGVEEVFTSRNMSFMSFGVTSANSLYMLIDAYAHYTDRRSRKIVIEVANSIIGKLSRIRAEEIREALEDKFEKHSSGYENGLYKAVMSALRLEGK